MQKAECRINGKDTSRTTLSAKGGPASGGHALRKSAAALLSGVLLFCSFPPFEYFPLAWMALTPLIYLCFCSSSRDSFLYGLLAGAGFWLASIFWLGKVSVIGWIFISFYCALYMALFASVVSWWRSLMDRNTNLPQSLPELGQGSTSDTKHKSDCAFLWPDLIFLFGLPAIWVGLEYARTQLLTGFPWNLLGVSQFACLPLIQCADLGGVYLVSYLIVMGNAAFALMIYNRREGILKTGPVLVLFLLIIFLVLQYGRWRLNQSSEKLASIRTAAVQLNVPQQYKWSEDWAKDIYRRLRKSTAAVCKSAPPDLIVWPETALPDFIRYDELSGEVVNEVRRHGIPLLVGTMDYEVYPAQTNYFNSSFLFLSRVHEPQIYKKRHLVICGEYVPLARCLPFLRSITGIEEDFMPGAESTVFRLQDEGKKFSVLICFEDIFPYLARTCVLAGARLLINQTNDAWFDPSWASRQHMAQGVFRCVENRVACLRATNTGLTCYLDRFGSIRASLEPLGRANREPQIMRGEAEFSAENMPLTFYTRHGDLFALACAAFSLSLFIGIVLNFRNHFCGLSRRHDK